MNKMEMSILWKGCTKESSLSIGMLASAYWYVYPNQITGVSCKLEGWKYGG